MKKVSIIIPCYNAERFVAQTLDSALKQTWGHLEIIAVDDGSTDGTPGILDRYRASGVTVLSQPNRGAGAAKNNALAVCSGDFIQYLDSDDLLSPDKIEAQVNRLEAAPGSDVCFCKWSHFFRPDASDAAFPDFTRYRDYADPVEMLVAMWTEDWHLTNHAWLISRRIADLIGPWDRHVRFTAFDDDFEYFTRAVCANGAVTYSPEGRVYYRQGEASAASALKASPDRVRDMFSGLKERDRTLRAREDSPRVQEAIACQYYKFAAAFYGLSAEVDQEARARLSVLGLPPPARLGSPLMRRLAKGLGFWPALRLIRALTRAKACFRRPS